MMLKILGCGTSTGVPIPSCECAVCLSSDPKNKRLRTSAVIYGDAGEVVLIDATTDLRQQALAHGVKRLTHVLFTHAHADHILGIDDLRCFNFTQRASIPCFATPPTLTEIKRIFSYIIDPDPYWEGGLLPQLSFNEVQFFKPVLLGELSVLPFPLVHGRAEVAGFRIGDLAYATDCKVIPDQSKEVLCGVRSLVLDGLRYQEHKSHLTIPQAISIAQELKVEQTYLIHMTHSVDYGEVNGKLPAGVQLAYDGLEIPLRA